MKTIDKIKQTNGDYCLNCGIDLRGEPIPEKFHKHYGPPYYYNRAITLIDVTADCVVKSICPDCKYQWTPPQEKEKSYGR